MIVVLDATALCQDPLCTGTAWRVLVPAVARWGLQLVIPEVVLAEAVHSYARKVEQARGHLEGWARKHRASLGEDPGLTAGSAALADLGSKYEDRLRTILAEMGAIITPPPPIAHMFVVRRAAARRRPCDDKGDGYRDTLNWLSILEILAKDKDNQVLWVSNNFKDFGATDDESALHPQLIEDLAEIDAVDRLVWRKTLPDTALHLVEINSSGADGESLSSAKNRLQDEAIAEFVTSVLLPQAVDAELTPRRCGLPLGTRMARVRQVKEVLELSTELRGLSDNDESVVEVVGTFRTEVDLRLDEAPHEDDRILTYEVDGDGHSGLLTKDLRYRGIIRIGSFGQPLEGEWVTITALESDEGLNRWKARRGLGLTGLYSSPIPQSVFDALRQPVIPTSVFDAIRAPIIPTSVFDAIRAPIIPTSVFDAIRAPFIPTSVFDAIRAPIISTSVLDAIRGPAIRPIRSQLKPPANDDDSQNSTAEDPPEAPTDDGGTDERDE